MKRRGSWPKSGPFDRVPLAWFEPQHYARMFEIVNDVKTIPLDYEQWRQHAENKKRHWERLGHLVVTVIVEPDIFLAWCAANAIEPGVNAFHRYLIYRVAPETARHR